MSWGSDLEANKFKKSYIKGFLDVSGGNIIAQNTSSVIVMSNIPGVPAMLIAPDKVVVSDGNTSYDISYAAFGALATIGVSFEQSSAELLNRTKFLNTNTFFGNLTTIGNSIADCGLSVFGNADISNSLYVGKDISLNGRLIGYGDMSMNGNIYVGKDISANGSISLSGNLTSGGNAVLKQDASLNGNLLAGGQIVVNGLIYGKNDISLNGTLVIGSTLVANGDASLNSNLKLAQNATVGGNLVVSMDGSFNKNVYVGGDVSANGNVFAAKDVSMNQKLRVGGDVSFNQRLSVGGDVSFNSNLTVILDVSLNKRLFLSGDASLNGNVFVAKDVSMNQRLSVGGNVSLYGNLMVSYDVSLNQRLIIGGDVSANGNLYVVKDVSLNQRLSIGGDVSANGNAFIAKDVSINQKLFIGGDVSANGNLFAAKDVSMNQRLFVGGDVSLNSNLMVLLDVSLNKRLFISGDISANGNVFIAKDVSMNQQLFIGGDVSANGNVFISKDVSMNQRLYVGGDVSLNGNLTVLQDVSLNQRLYIGGDVSMNGNMFAAKDVSMNQRLYVGGDASMNGNAFIAKDVSMNQQLYIGGDVSMNGNAYVKNILTIGKDVSAGYSLDVSGTSILRNTLFVRRDVSGVAIDVSGFSALRDSVAIGKDVSSGYALDVSGLVQIRNSVSVGKDASAGYSLDVSGTSILRNTLFVRRDASGIALDVSGEIQLKNGGLTIGKDVSYGNAIDISGYALDVSGFTVFRNRVAINKDISSAYMLDVSGVSQFRGNVDISGTFTVYGQPLSAGASLTGNVQVGSNNGYVTINKPQFLADPSLLIFYNFDTSYNGGTRIYNSGAGGAAYDASLGINGGSTSGMIDTSIYKYGTASLKNDPNLTPTSNRGAGTMNVPISSQMSFSFWIYKKSVPLNPDWDRVFELTSNTGYGQSENDTIALDISSNGYIYPVVYDVSTGSNNLISSPQINPFSAYNICNSTWNHIVWTINNTSSTIYVNGTVVQSDTLSYSITDTSRNQLLIAYYSTSGQKDFSGNLDNFRYYKDKVLTVAEVYQLYTNKFYTLDICGGYIANGSSVIYEPTGSEATSDGGSLTLMRGNRSGTSSIVFKSNNDRQDYAYVQYTDANNAGLSLLKYDFSVNTPTFPAATIPSTGTLSIGLIAAPPPNNSLNWFSNTTSLNGVTPAYCISFNQTNLSTTDTTNYINYLEAGNLPRFDNFSFSAWIRPTTLDPSGIQWMILNLTNATADGVIDIYCNSNGKFVVIFNDDWTNFIYSTSSLVINTWYHVVFTYNSAIKNGFIYINGQLDTTVALTGLSGKTLSANQHIILGMKYGWNQGTGTNSTFTTNNTFKGFRGQMAFVNIFDRPLTASDVAYLYNNPGYNLSINPERGLMTIGIENDLGTVNGDRIALMPGAGTGNVGINTRNPGATLDVSGDINCLSLDSASDIIVNGVRIGKGPGNNVGNVVFGPSSLSTNFMDPSGFQNSAFGYGTLQYNRSGYKNTAVGYTALQRNTNGFHNTAIGTEANINITTQNSNTAIGFGAGNGGQINYVGDNNTFLGSNTFMYGAFTNSTAVGWNAGITGNNQVVLGYNCTANAMAFNATSDYREKKEVRDLDESYSVDGLRPVSYKFIKNDNTMHVGFIAHEVQEVFPFLVTGEKDGPFTQSLNYNGFIGILTKELKDLKATVAELKGTIVDMESKLQEQSSKLQEQSSKLQEQSSKLQEQSSKLQEQSSKLFEQDAQIKTLLGLE